MKKVTDIHNMKDDRVYFYIHRTNPPFLLRSQATDKISVMISKITGRRYGSISEFHKNHMIGYSYDFTAEGVRYSFTNRGFSIYSDWTKYVFELTDEEIIEHFVLDLI